MLREAGLGLSDAFASGGGAGANAAEGGAEGGSAAAGEAAPGGSGGLLESMGRTQQLLNPATLNMRQLRAACESRTLQSGRPSRRRRRRHRRCRRWRLPSA